ncbi:MAG: TetR/AcrR family transcriptional regulator [Clostridia bacterium]|nr:TetR/AcrR family transcriptional regulator [Clostridia bacterium]
MEKRRKSREQRLDEIMAAATKLFSEKGYCQTTMEDIVRETGLSKGGLYHYFDSTKTILIELMSRGNMYYMRYNPHMQSIDATLSREEKAHLLLEAFLDKALDVTDEKKVYAMFLFEAMHDQELWEAFIEYERIFMVYMFGKLGVPIPSCLDDFYFFSQLLNALLLGQHTTKEPERMLAYKESLSKMLYPLVLSLIQ